MPDERSSRCPICGQPTRDGYRPFCSKRCADIDLGRWLSGSYAIEGSRLDESDDGDRPADHCDDRDEPDER